MKKMIFLVTIDSVSKKLHEFLEKNTEMYFEIPYGKGKYKYYHRMDDHIWPGNVSAYIIPTEEEKIHELKKNMCGFLEGISTEHYFMLMVVPIEDFELFQGAMKV
ncbi:MAG: hypothetical protein ACOCWO_02685 [Candidatus Muiribacteriaceae bacterium]